MGWGRIKGKKRKGEKKKGKKGRKMKFFLLKKNFYIPQNVFLTNFIINYNKILDKQKKNW